jgi:hypothetical protein
VHSKFSHLSLLSQAEKNSKSLSKTIFLPKFMKLEYVQDIVEFSKLGSFAKYVVCTSFFVLN